METPCDRRVILHVDVDCFYAQVEESRRPELKGRPLGIYQKFLVVTCNYPARNAGVAKMCPKEDALRVCPDLVLVNGEDLTPYRAVSKRILEVMRRFGTVERRGMDEAYLDITGEVNRRMGLAMGPNPVYRGFVGKVLAGPSEKGVLSAEPTRQLSTTSSQHVPLGKPRPIPEPSQGPVLGSGVSQVQTGNPSQLEDVWVSPKGLEGLNPLKGAADGVTAEGGIGQLRALSAGDGQRAGEASLAFERGVGVSRRGHVAEAVSAGGEGVNRAGLTLSGAENGTSVDWERVDETSFTPEEKVGVPSGGDSFSGVPTERYVPPGWRPLLRTERDRQNRDDVVMTGESRGDALAHVAGGEIEGEARQKQDRGSIQNSQEEVGWSGYAPSVEVFEGHNEGLQERSSGEFGEGLSRESGGGLGKGFGSGSNGGLKGRLSGRFAGDPPGTAEPGLVGDGQDVSNPSSEGLVTPAALNPLPPAPSPLSAQPQYGTLAEAFGSVLKRPPEATETSLNDCLPPRKRAKSDLEDNTDRKKISWLDWRNEVDSGLPPGTPSPGHEIPGKSARGKLPGHWSDVRLVRFQPAAPDGVLKTSERLDFGADVAGSDWLLLVGSQVAAEVREAIWAEVGCRCSAGMAHNKMLAKLASPMNKPNGQTTMLAGAVADHIRNLPARKIPGIGWSYDAKLRDMKVDTIGDLQKLSLTELEEKFGARVGSMIYNCCRGNDTSLVEDKGPPKSLSVEDSFRACLNLKQAEGVVKALAPDYIERLDEERVDTGRRPKTLTVKWRQKGASYQGQSTSGPMPLDVVSPSLAKPRREEALIRSTMALLSKVFSGKKFHLVKLNVGATNFIEDASKGTSSLLRSWAGKGGERSGLMAEKGTERKEKLAERDGSPSVLEAEESRSPLGRGAEKDLNLGETGAEGTRSPLEGNRAGFRDSVQWNAERSRSPSEGGAVKKSGAAAPDGASRDELGAQSPLKSGFGGEKVEEDQVGRIPLERNGTESTTAEGTTGLSSVLGVNRGGVWGSGAPQERKGLGGDGAVAGSVLHANLGSKRDARAAREALEGVKPVLGNGHTQTQRPWQRSANLSGLGDQTKPGGDLGMEWDAEEDGFAGEGRGFRGDFGGESEGEEDLWNDLQSVQWERQSFPVPGSSRKVEQFESHGASDKAQITVKDRSGELCAGEMTQRKGTGLQALWGRTPSGPRLREEGGDVLELIARGECGNGSLGLAEADGRRSLEVDENLANSWAAGVDVSEKRQCKPDVSEHALVGANLLDTEMQLAAVTTKQSVLYSLSDNEVGSHIKRSVGVSRVEANDKDGGLASKSFSEKCSTCGEVLPVDPLSRQEHIDFHVAVKLQEQEEKIGRLFKAASGRSGAKKASSSSQARAPGSSCASQKSTRTLDAFYKRS